MHAHAHTHTHTCTWKELRPSQKDDAHLTD